jgi:hypothetical protein
MSMLDARPAGEKMPVVHYNSAGQPVPPWAPPIELRKLPRHVQESILSASARLAEREYRTNRDLTDFEAFAEEP